MPAERIRLRIGSIAKAVLVTGQAYQDPKDALNEFVSNAADEYAEAGRSGARIRVLLRRKGKHPMIVVQDWGRGMDPARLRAITKNLFESAKADDPRTLGEKAIGLLAFQQLGARCDVVSRADSSAETHVLRLARGQAVAHLERDRRRHLAEPGTAVYISDLDPDVARVLTPRKVVDYLRRRRGPALARGDYSIEVVEGRAAELVTAEEPDGVRLALGAHATLWGRIEFHLYVAPRPDRRRRVTVVGRAGTTILDDVSEIEEFAGAPWSTDQISGQIVFEALKQTAGRRAVLRDRDAFPVFVDTVRSIEPAIARTLQQIAREVDLQTADRLAETVRKIFSRVLKELTDLENPMRTSSGPDEGGDGLFAPEREHVERDRLDDSADPTGHEPSVEDLIPPASSPPVAKEPPPAGPGGGRHKELPTLAPDPAPGETRSRFDPHERIVYYNDRHADYLLVKDEETVLLDYLATLVAKEYIVYNNPRAPSAELGEELVRMLVRVRRHLPKAR